MAKTPTQFDGISQTELAIHVQGLLDQMDPKEAAKLEYQRALSDADRARKEKADAEAREGHWKTLIFEKVVLGVIVIYASWYFNSQLEVYKSTSSMKTEYRKIVIDATRDALKAAAGSYIDGQLVCRASKENDDEGHKTVEELQEHLRDEGTRLTEASALIDVSLARPLNLIANAGTEYLSACDNNARKDEIRHQVCAAQRELHTRIEAMAMGTTLDEGKIREAAIVDCMPR
jgi:hypothetical protein